MDIVVRLAPLLLSRGIPSGSPQVCKGGDSCRCWALEGVSIIPAISLPTHVFGERILVQDAQPSLQIPKGWALVRRKDLLL